MEVNFTIGNSLLQVSSPTGELPLDLKKRLESRLSYSHVSFNHTGAFRRQPAFSSEVRTVFKYDQKNNLVCPRGFTKRLKAELSSSGITVNVIDLDGEYHSSPAFCIDFERLNQTISLREKQDDCLASIMSSRDGLIVAPTGFGKSFMFSAICMAYPDAKIHIVTRRVDVMKRLYGSLSKLIPTVGMVGSGSNRWGRVTVITADSMHRISHSGEQCADILLYDEAHEAVASSYQSELGKYLKTRKFGFTASPDGRMDGAHFLLEAIFGPRIFEMSYDEAVASNLVVPIKVEWINVDCVNPCGDLNGVPKERWGIWRNEVRNLAIAEKAKEYSADDQVLIMVKSVEHAVYLKQVLPDFKLCYDTMDTDDYQRYVKKGLIDPADEPLMVPARRENMRVKFERGELKKVISTDVWSTGVDFAQLAVLIRADARASKIVDIQAPGRVARKHDPSGKSSGLVIDCMDNFDFSFMNRSRSRRLSYKKMGWEEIKNNLKPPMESIEGIDVMEEAFDE
jgi:superfamily II DNA or RNA helicase